MAKQSDYKQPKVVANADITLSGNCLNESNISVGAVSKGNQMGDRVNPYGTGVMRGFGAATKGKKISGKMG